MCLIFFYYSHWGWIPEECVDVTKALKSHFDVYAPSFASALENVNFRRAFGARGFYMCYKVRFQTNHRVQLLRKYTYSVWGMFFINYKDLRTNSSLYLNLVGYTHDLHGWYGRKPQEMPGVRVLPTYWFVPCVLHISWKVAIRIATYYHWL